MASGGGGAQRDWVAEYYQREAQRRQLESLEETARINEERSEALKLREARTVAEEAESRSYFRREGIFGSRSLLGRSGFGGFDRPDTRDPADYDPERYRAPTGPQKPKPAPKSQEGSQRELYESETDFYKDFLEARQSMDRYLWNEVGEYDPWRREELDILDFWGSDARDSYSRYGNARDQFARYRRDREIGRRIRNFERRR